MGTVTATVLFLLNSCKTILKKLFISGTKVSALKKIRTSPSEFKAP